MNGLQRYPCVLAVYLNTRGFGFVVFESSLSPVDWGIKETPGPQKNSRCVTKIERILDRYRPSVLILQDTSAGGTRRTQRIKDLNAEIVELAALREIPACAYSRADVLTTFSEFNVETKRDLALVIAKHIPAFERHLPPPRKPWMSEDARMSLFEAAALALTFFHSAGDERDQEPPA
ncbi:hypothetical protein A1D31_33730 [Bradyrhizobium liaoningense]|nr:hypothetical protein A1D31_33730 [Bradyrhizobium liaoningense]